MSTSQDASRRTARLQKLFRDTVSGNRPVRNPQDAQLFLEAIRGQEPASRCVEILVGNPSGLAAVGDAIRSDLSLQFILSHTLPFLRYLADPGVKALVDGQHLEQVLVVVASPPTALNTLVNLFNNLQIPDDGLFAFGWLALELISVDSRAKVDVANVVKAINGSQQFLQSKDYATRELGYKIQKIIRIRCSNQDADTLNGAGGRHDNDFSDFRKIRIYPTTDEFLSTQTPYYQTAKEVAETDLERRAGVHLDNQFRLLREDMLAELREDLQVATGAKKGKRTSIVLSRLFPSGIDIGDEAAARYKRCTLLLQCFSGLHFLQDREPKARKKFLQDHPGFLKHQAFGVLCRGEEIFGFAFVDRNIDRLAQSPPVVSLQFTDDVGLKNALLALRTTPGSDTVQFILVDTPVFAYEPVLLGLQRMTDVPLFEALVNPVILSDGSPPDFKISPILQGLASRLQAKPDTSPLSTGSGTRLATRLLGPINLDILDTTQLEALYLALTSLVSLIQGPPGTGKSFVGALAVRFFVDAGLRVLVLSYTNHALDQFLEDLLQAEIPSSSIVRIGSKAKCTPKTAPLLLSEQKGQHRRSREAWDVINKYKDIASESGRKLQAALATFLSSSIKWADFEEYLEFSEDGQPFLEALRVSTDKSNGGWEQAGKQGKKVGLDYLYKRWIKGDGPGIFAKVLSESARAIWDMPRAVRIETCQKWLKALMEEDLQGIQDLSTHFNDVQSKIDAQFNEANAQLLTQKQVIGCTTTAAAKYAHLIRAAKPDVILVEEAGEILESHILTALASTVKQLVLIGDHKQLRPKINNYALSVERGDGFDLNCSLFERLINQGARHVTLQKQHRMAPEISVFARELTYPDLLDGPKTSGRPQIHGLQDRVVFLNHGRQEDSDKQLRDRRDPGMKESKKNIFEAEMVLRCVKYLGQQGYSSEQIVVLTPYLGQLRVLQDLFRKNNHDLTISEMDKAELIRAGLISEAAAKLDKKPLRISTIDNYQGEESDIVVASLTRSNESGDIGFMSAPERLNVLITRARNCLILIGNMDTFMRSKKGKPTWHPLFDLLKDKGHIYDGLPVKCGKHLERTALLKEPMDFDKICPDGGCTELCDAPLKCGMHKCTSRCHRIVDHSRTECNQLIQKICDRQHKIKVRCSKRNDGCHKCIQEDKEMERQIKRDLQLEEDRRRREEEYMRELQQIQDELVHQRRINKYQAEEEQRKQALEQHQADLVALKNAEVKLRQQNELKAKMESKKAEKLKKTQKQDQKTAPPSPSTQPDCLSGAQAEWDFMKENEGAQSKPLDQLMEMIGLEDVKQEFLSIKSKVDTALRQGISLASERFSCSMLGNPGTGKTTVARLYAQFLTDLCVIPGSRFEETTGAALANQGVAGCTKRIDGILNGGGGVLFIDEAYQLTSGNNPGGGAVLDYLLAEVENLRGKVVFVLAGYNKQMESFFAHNPGLPSRFPIDMRFSDYSDEELLNILELKVNKKYNSMMDCEDGLKGLYCRIVARRIGRARGKEGFGNARSVENSLDMISRRQVDRLREERKSGAKPDDFLFTKEDLIGPEPGEALRNCQTWKKLENLLGLAAVKQAVQSLVDSIQQNYLRELAEEPPIQYSLNKVFCGNPGTGKTTVAKLYGEILVSLGLLSKGEVVVKNPSDFVGAHLGQSEQQTKGILAASVGKVLVIDEAYGLYGGGGTADPYKTAVIDTIVAEVQSVPGEDRCVLLLGYKDQMEDMFQNVNPGLQRRFPMSSAFHFEDFSKEELQKILELKLEQQGFDITDQATRVAMEMLERARNRPNFGNAGEIDILVDGAKARHQIRFSKKLAKSANLLEAIDFDENFDRAEKSETNVRRLFEGTVGCEDTISLLESYQDTVRTLKALDMDPKENIPFNFLFRGPPGTGKTTTARKFGKVFYDMGFLATDEVVECSTTDLIGQYVGHTGPKVQQVLDKALGKVLFVDEAYRLAEGHFAKEAMDEIVDLVTKERYFKKLIIILAGYEADINRLMTVNSGLTSRFPAVIDFRALNAKECLALMVKLMQRQKRILESKGKELDLSCLEEPALQFKEDVLGALSELAAQDNWASARDVHGLATGMFNRILRGNKEGLSKGRVVLTEDDVVQELKGMLSERGSRSKTGTPLQLHLRKLLQPQLQPAPPVLSSPPPQVSTASSTSQSQAQPPTSMEEQKLEDESKGPEKKPEEGRPLPTDHDHLRDPGVSNAVWKQLQLDRLAEQQREEEYKQLQEDARKAATEAAREKIVKRLLEEEARRKREEEMRKKLKEMGRCPMGYEWIKQTNGWRCAGGSHWVGERELGM